MEPGLGHLSNIGRRDSLCGSDVVQLCKYFFFTSGFDHQPSIDHCVCSMVGLFVTSMNAMLNAEY